jgi:pimeloyl-ACP methyl ester carboxylesterase
VADVVSSDHAVPTSRGCLFARSWRPAAARGDGPAFLLFHDSLGSVELWRDFPEQLARTTGVPVAAYDRLGFGKSDPRSGPMPYDFMREEARLSLPALRETLGLKRLIPFGHSVGGAMATGVAARLSEACEALITVSAQAFVEQRTIDGLREAKAAFAAPGQVERLSRYHGDKARWVLDAWLETWLAPTFADWTLDEDLSQVRCPTLALHGESDEYGSSAHPQRIAAGVKGPGRAVILKDCGHVPHREAPDALIAEVTAFLRSAT